MSITVCEIDSHWEAAVSHRKATLALCDNLESLVERGEGSRGRGYIYIYICD